MKKFAAYFRVSLTDALEYRGDIFLYAISAVMLPVTNLLLWIAVGNTGLSSPLSSAEFVRYYTFQLLVGLWVFNWGAYFISRDIRLGRISSWLIKPAPFLSHQAGNNISEKILKTVYLIPVTVIFCLIFKFTWPLLSVYKWLLFFISWVMAGIIAFLFDVSIGLLAFWIDEPNAVRESYSILYLVFSGRILPLFTMPVILQKISFILPFRYTLSLPLEVILDKLSDWQLFQGLAIQALYLIISICLYRYLWRLGTKKYSASGN